MKKNVPAQINADKVNLVVVLGCMCVKKFYLDISNFSEDLNLERIPASLFQPGAGVDSTRLSIGDVSVAVNINISQCLTNKIEKPTKPTEITATPIVT